MKFMILLHKHVLYEHLGDVMTPGVEVVECAPEELGELVFMISVNMIPEIAEANGVERKNVNIVPHQIVVLP
ncbi:MAG: hypothetical protein Q8R13_02690 [bacterium]|nr:hypothetical protein [bacterium]MDZ4296519.1 hypothetical protein [Patescibacteria group bacterium]